MHYLFHEDTIEIYSEDRELEDMPLNCYEYCSDTGLWFTVRLDPENIEQWINIGPSQVPKKYRLQLLLVK